MTEHGVEPKAWTLSSIITVLSTVEKSAEAEPLVCEMVHFHNIDQFHVWQHQCY
jgi:hypothetical protein